MVERARVPPFCCKGVQPTVRLQLRFGGSVRKVGMERKVGWFLDRQGDEIQGQVHRV